MDAPLWLYQLNWEGPESFSKLVAGQKTLTGAIKGSGVYMFTIGSGKPLNSRVLYIGKADGTKQTLRRRIGVYIGRMRRSAPPLKLHTGMEKLAEFYKKHPHDLYIRWAGCVVARDIEGRLIDYYEPEFNSRVEFSVYADDELIPLEYL